ncbi:response regulator [Mucilaginibacter sp.]|jgi:two-component system phosphate regulon response regulator PhoB|uniref:response regulator n=1 Tax=Mucilaginibacter sp. TaxID=1882438 RepID=UPI0025FEFC77|nr:response regulator [Mucilaginibacter sp.]
MIKKILVIEDDEDILDSIDTLLSLNNFEVKGITQTDDIIAVVKANNPDLVLTDYILPGMNGGKICQVIKNDKELAHIPVILMTAYHKQAIAIGNFGHDAYLPKPFENQHLVNIINKLLN